MFVLRRIHIRLRRRVSASRRVVCRLWLSDSLYGRHVVVRLPLAVFGAAGRRSLVVVCLPLAAFGCLVVVVKSLSSSSA